MKKLKNPIIVIMLLAVGCFTACNKFPFDNEDPKPKEECVDPKKVCTTCFCTMNYDPVCGCNDVTYGNACEASAAGVLKFTKGACPNKNDIKELLTYSYSGEPMLDGCGSIFNKADGSFLVPEKEDQVPEEFKNLQTFAPAKYTVVYQIVGTNDKWQCGMNIETHKATIIRIKQMIPA